MSGKVQDLQSLSNSRSTLGVTRALLASGVVGPLLFIVVFLIEGATRPGYSVSRNYVSDLSLSDQGWEQVVNFLVCGVLIVAFAIGVHRVWSSDRGSVWGPRLVGLMGLGLIIAGSFSIDPAHGYPPGAPLTGEPQSLHGWIHGINGLVLFNVVLPAACFVMSRRFASEPGGRVWARYSVISGLLVLVLSLVSTVGAPLMESGAIPFPIGLIQRGQIIIGWVWLALTARRLLLEAGREVAPPARP